MDPYIELMYRYDGPISQCNDPLIRDHGNASVYDWPFLGYNEALSSSKDSGTRHLEPQPRIVLGSFQESGHPDDDVQARRL